MLCVHGLNVNIKAIPPHAFKDGPSGLGRVLEGLHRAFGLQHFLPKIRPKLFLAW
jgi:hypothetical protein